jgi:5-methylthioribose kinase
MIISYQTDNEQLSIYLKEQRFIDPEEIILGLEKPGEGNMNFVARVRTQKRSIIIKQANPYVQKYPQISAPQERLLVETEFYRTIQNYENLARFMPLIIGMDPTNYVLVLEDLGMSNDMTYLYKKGNYLSVAELEQLIQFLNALHAIPFDKVFKYSKNLDLRKLNHEHLFNYPFMEDNGFDLNQIQPGLQSIALVYKTDSPFKMKVMELGQKYLSQGKALLHGDYYPGSWLKTADNLKIIDPEFSFVGYREFELGIFIAHLKMTQAPSIQVDRVITNYQGGDQFNWKICYQFAGIEIMRRIIGLAQLPFDLTLKEKEMLLKEAHTFIVKAV